MAARQSLPGGLAPGVCGGSRFSTGMARALDLLHRAVMMGSGNAAHGLAIVFRDGELGQAKDKERAVSFFRKSAELGCREGRVALAKILEDGELGVDVDLKQALHWWEKAGEQCTYWYRDGFEIGAGIERVRAAIVTQSDSNSDAE